MYTVPFAKSALSFVFCQLSELMLRFVLTPGKQKDAALYRQWQHTSLVTCTLTGLIFLFSLSPFPAVYPNQDPELSYQKRALEKLAALNVKTFGKKKILIWTSLATACQD